MGWVTRTIGSTTLDCHWKNGGWVGSGNLAFCSGTEPTLFRNLQKGSLTCEERGIFPNTVHHYGLRSGFPYYGLTTPACNYARGTPFNHLGHTTQLLCGQSTLTTGQGSEHFVVAFYDKLSATAGLFFSLTPGTRTGR